MTFKNLKHLKPVFILACAMLLFLITLVRYIQQSKVQFEFQKQHILSQYVPGSLEWKRTFAILAAMENNAHEYVFYHEGTMEPPKKSGAENGK